MKRYEEKLFREVSITPDLLYHTAPGYDKNHTETQLCLDVYAPAGDTEKNRRAVILVHGGGFFKCDKRQDYIVILGKLFAQYGYVCFSLDYRLFPSREERPSGCESAKCTAMDVEAARTWILRRKDEFGIDPETLFICGGSAGGMTSLESCRVYPDYKALICLWGAYPNIELPEKYPPTFLVHGTADKLVPHENSERFFEQLKKQGVPAELVILPNAPHTAIRWLPDYEEKMIRFMNQHA